MTVICTNEAVCDFTADISSFHTDLFRPLLAALRIAPQVTPVTPQQLAVGQVRQKPGAFIDLLISEEIS